MRREHRHKTVAYIIVAIIIVIILGLYVYSVLSVSQTTPTSQVAPRSSTSGLIMLTPAESAQKAALIQSFMSQGVAPVSVSQASTKAALVKKFQSGK